MYDLELQLSLSKNQHNNDLLYSLSHDMPSFYLHHLLAPPTHPSCQPASAAASRPPSQLSSPMSCHAAHNKAKEIGQGISYFTNLTY